jgi:hypothetical protein
VSHYLEKTVHKKGLLEWLKVWALSSNPSTEKKKSSYDIMFEFNPSITLLYPPSLPFLEQISFFHFHI